MSMESIWSDTVRQTDGVFPPALTIQSLNDLYKKAYGSGNAPNIVVIKQRTYEHLRHNMKRRPAPRYCQKRKR